MAFRVMTWNVENLFRPAVDAAAEAQAAYQQKLQGLAARINAVAPDVVALQEVGGPQALADLQAALGGAYPRQRISDFPDDRGITVAFLSKLSVQDGEDILMFPADPPPAEGGAAPPSPPLAITNENGGSIVRLSRGALRIAVQVGALRVHLITTHLKSKLLTFGNGQFSTNDEALRARVGAVALLRRTAEVTTLRLRVNTLLQLQPNDGVILLGDLNDGVEAATTQILHGPTGSQFPTLGFDRPDSGDPQRLFNLAGFIPEERRFSRRHNGVGELIDQILVSEELVPRDGNQRVRPAADTFPEPTGVPSIGDNPTARRNVPVSDHAPVAAWFDI